MDLWYTVEDLSLEFDDLPIDDDGNIKEAFLESVLKETQTFIMSYLRKMKTFKEDQPSQLVILEIKAAYLNVAHYRYSNKDHTLTEVTIERYKESLEYLREIAAGKVLLGELPEKVGLINRKLQRG